MPRAKSLLLEPRLKIWFESGGEYAFGFGLCEMLEAVQTRIDQRGCFGNWQELSPRLGPD